MLTDKTAYFCEVHIGEDSVVWPAGGHHHVVNHCQITKEPLDRNGVRGVEGSSAQRINLARRPLEAFGAPGGEDDLSPFRASVSGRFESDAGATADHNDGLPQQFRFPLGGGGAGYGAHDSSYPPVQNLSHAGSGQHESASGPVVGPRNARFVAPVSRLLLPASAECLIELDKASVFVAAGRRERQFSRIE